MKTSPATGICRWLKDAPNGNRVLLINNQEYEVISIKGGYRLLRVCVKTGELIRYEVKLWTPGRWICDCPDAKNRRQGNCKHCRAVTVAMKALPF